MHEVEDIKPAEVTELKPVKRRGRPARKKYRCTHKTKIWFDGFTMVRNEIRPLSEKEAEGHRQHLMVVE